MNPKYPERNSPPRNPTETRQVPRPKALQTINEAKRQGQGEKGRPGQNTQQQVMEIDWESTPKVLSYC